jgi:hypothetical protein
MVDNLTAKSTMQADGSKPIIENATLPSMDDALRSASAEPRSRVPELGANLMGPSAQGQSANPPTNLMAPVPETVRTEQQSGQNVMRQLQPEEKYVQKYVRLRLRVENGALSLMGASAVEGPLVMEEHLHGPLVYEVGTDQTRLAIGSIPDLGICRSFPHPQPVPGQEGHHITAVSSDEFTVRVPQQQFAAVALPDVQVRVYRVKGGKPDLSTGSRSLPLRSTPELRQVAQLQGIHLDTLPDGVQTELMQALQ